MDNTIQQILQRDRTIDLELCAGFALFVDSRVSESTSRCGHIRAIATNFIEYRPKSEHSGVIRHETHHRSY